MSNKIYKSKQVLIRNSVRDKWVKAYLIGELEHGEKRYMCVYSLSAYMMGVEFAFPYKYKKDIDKTLFY